MDDRKGALTPEQEKILDDLIKLKGIPELVDGIVIRVIDDQAIDRLLAPAKAETRQLVYDIIDTIFEGLETIVNYK